MSQPILIIKTGQTLETLRSNKGDFEDWIIAGMGIGYDQVKIVDVYQGYALPKYDEIAGIVITGSHAMVTEHQDWSEKTADWLAEAVSQNIPTLGICYGHQLLAYALGGDVGNNPQGQEFGTVDVYLNDQAIADPLFGVFPSSIKAHVCHSQSVLKLPKDAILLASSERESHQVFVVNNCAWGVQFHPEFNSEIVKEYINYVRDILLEDKQDPEALIEQSPETDHSHKILQRFVNFVNKS